MDQPGMLTPVRKRPRSQTPSSSSPNNINKRHRCRSNSLTSTSLALKYTHISGIDEPDGDTVMDSDVPESPIVQRRPAAVSFAAPLFTPAREISNPFAKLNIKASAQKTATLATPVKLKSSAEGNKSVKKSARKTPGSGKNNKPLPFKIQSSATSLIDHLLTVVPIASFPRYLMPIQWTVGSTPRVFTTQGNRMIPLSGAVMIAKVEGEKNMVVIEKIGECLYSMCALKKDLKIKDIRTAARSAKECEIPSQIQTETDEMEIDGNEWWRGLMVRPSQLKPRQDATLQLNLLVQDGSANSNTERSATVVSGPSLFVRHESEFSAPDSGYASSPQEALSQTTTSIISQYLEALYSTKTSLAYFAKSTLARARAEFQRMKASSNEQCLLSFLQNIILSEDDFNTKYENFLPGIKSDEMEKSMLAITEEERKYLIQKFWRNGGDESEVNESALQREIQELKIREMQLQIIIIAELLALHEEWKDDQDRLDQMKRTNFELLLTSHLDRLSISSMLQSDNDFSEQFFREILLPFYGSRLPQILDMVGGPMDFSSPVKPVKKPYSKATIRQSILSPNTLKRISRPQPHDLSPTPIPLTSRKTFKSTPKKQKLSKSAGVLKRLQKTEVNITHTVQNKKAKRTLGRMGSTFSGAGGIEKKLKDQMLMRIDDGAEVQVPATPAPRKSVGL